MKTQLLILILTLFACNAIGANQTFVLSGNVQDSITGEVIPAANIVVKDQDTGTISNFSGTYILYLQKGEYTITFSHKGYRVKEIQIELNENQELTAKLVPSSEEKNIISRMFKKEEAHRLISKK